MKSLWILLCGTLLTLGSTGSVVTSADISHLQKERYAQQGRPRSSSELSKLVNDLRTNGATVNLSDEKISQPFFSSRGRVLYVNDQPVWVFAYPVTTTADKDARKISRDGMTIGTSKPSWLGTPHFFKRARLIVLYLGDDTKVINALQHSLGDQFAGG